MRLFMDRQTLFLVLILLIACLLIVGCGSKASAPETSPRSEGRQENIQQEADISHGQEGQKQEESIDRVDPAPKAEESKTSPEKSSSNGKGQEDEKNQSKEEEKPGDADPAPSVTISIVGHKAMGVILEATEVEIEEGETVLDALKKAAKQNNIPISIRGKKSTAYVEGINNLFEFDHGPRSGWLYRVNGSMYSKSAGAFTVNAGDVIEWLYTLDLGRDIEDSGGAADE